MMNKQYAGEVLYLMTFKFKVFFINYNIIRLLIKILINNT
jgi:hypothetical protein